ncbi:sensor histidine kinase [Agromyces mangrovi Wang et al. 2018]|uniref:sensor histidine kinase n=1 Tax=Agromyces mangrovi TaxID=1858653 RepID=UPI0025742F76|nr:histidine kinase [Agromyces mangrovi]BDZ65124.1 two-component sensor histidine kinase [Agromyces mangrovi]
MGGQRWWDLAAAATAVAAVAFSFIDPPYGSEEWGAIGATAGFIVVYLTVARRWLTGPTQLHHLWPTAALAAVLGVGVAFEPSYAIVQAFIYPFAWWTAATVRLAVLANLLPAAAIVLGYAIRAGLDGLLLGLAIAVLSLAGSLALGFWISRIAAYGAERARLLDELQAAQGELAAMHRDAGVSTERERLAREIHDTIAQSLTGLVMVAQRTRNELARGSAASVAAAEADVELIEQMARDALTEARSLVASMAPVRVESTLAEALARLGQRFARETGVAVQTAADASGLDRELEVVLLRCAQEGLANVRKHSHAARASIEVAASAREVVLTVLDDGVGPGDDPGGDGGFGVAGMRDRVALVGGTVSLEPGPAGGTALTVVVPLGAEVPA